MHLAANLGYVGMGLDTGCAEVAKAAEECGYRNVWVAEAYGSDAPTVLGWLAAHTSTIGLGSAVMQIPARSPAMTAMTMATLDLFSKGRAMLGLGVSGPQVSEGWHGVRFADPLGRTREYVDIVRLALSRKQVAYAGRHYTLPLPDGPGKSLHLTIPRPRAELPVYLAAVGPRNLELAGEIADGWLGVFFAPEHSEESLDRLAAGAERAGKGSGRAALAGFDIQVSVPVAIHDDVEVARRIVAPYCALYIGGMGSREQNFYNRLACRMGYEREAALVQQLYLEGRARDAAAAVPEGLIDQTCLVGPRARVRDRLSAYVQAGVTTLGVAPFALTNPARSEIVRTMAELLDDAGLAS